MNTAHLVLATCGPAALLGAWMLRNACRALARQAAQQDEQDRIDATFAELAARYYEQEPKP